jgi:DNA-binding transcriptional regulator YhcF (GntR family)
MVISVDASSGLPPAEQIRSQLAAQIRTGQLQPDSRLPPVRQLAADLRVAPGTVAKAYKELENVGLIRTARAAGTRVNPGHTTSGTIIKAAEELARQAAAEGMDLIEVQGLLAHAWTNVSGVSGGTNPR